MTDALDKALAEAAAKKKAPRKTSVNRKRNRGATPKTNPDTGAPYTRGPYVERSEARDLMFFQALSSGMAIKSAAEAAGYAKRTVFDWRDRDKEFAQRWDDAIEESIESLENEANRRAMHGSDTVLMFLLKARKPELYSQNAAMTLDGKLQVNMQVNYGPPETDK